MWVEAAPTEPLSQVLDAAENASPLQAVEAVTGALAAALTPRRPSSSSRTCPGGVSSASPMCRPAGRRMAPAAWARRAASGSMTRSGPSRCRSTAAPPRRRCAPRGSRLSHLRPRPPPPTAGSGGDQWVVLAPVTERGEVLGLLRAVPAGRAGGRGPGARSPGSAHLLAFVVIANRRHTDLFEWGQRSTPFTLPAEIQRRLLPAAFTCEAGSFTLSAWLEPAANVGGDTFDYSLGRDVLHLSHHRRDGPRRGQRPHRHPVRRQPAQHPPRRAPRCSSRPPPRNTALSDYAVSVSEEGYATGLLGRLDLTHRGPHAGQRGPRRPLPRPRRGGRAGRAAGRACRWACSPTGVLDHRPAPRAGRPARVRHRRDARTQRRRRWT